MMDFLCEATGKGAKVHILHLIPFSYRPVYLAQARLRSVTFHLSAWCRKKSEKVNTLATIVVLKNKKKIRPAHCGL